MNTSSPIAVPKATPLKTPDGRQTGFLLTSLRETDSVNRHEGECVFVMMPVSPDVIESELGVMISELKVGGEHKCVLDRNDSGGSLTVTPTSLPTIHFQIGSDGDATILLQESRGPKTVGKAVFDLRKE